MSPIPIPQTMPLLNLLGLMGALEKERRFQEAFYDLNEPKAERRQAVLNITARLERGEWT